MENTANDKYWVFKPKAQYPCPPLSNNTSKFTGKSLTMSDNINKTGNDLVRISKELFNEDFRQSSFDDKGDFKWSTLAEDKYRSPVSGFKTYLYTGTNSNNVRIVSTETGVWTLDKSGEERLRESLNKSKI